MTESEGHLDDSAASRFELWEKGIKMFIKSPLFGAGFGTYRYFGGRNDPHNYYIEMLSTQGIIGFSFIVLLFYYTFKNGGILYKEKGTEFLTGLGLSVQGITVAIIITNLFGDRWSYFHLGGYYWILMATVTNARSFAKRNTKNLTDEIRQKKTLQNKI